MNEISLKYKIIGSLVMLAVVFASGRYSVNGTIEKKVTDIQKNTEKVDHKKIVIDKKPDNEVITTITDDTDTKTKENDKITDNKTNAAAKRNIVNVSAMVANDFSSVLKPVYGISVNKEVLGPITAGVFGLTNGVIGITIGLDF